MWREHKPHEFIMVENMISEDPMVAVRNNNSYDAQYGLIQMSMDEELMHGASIKISYEITVTNKGELDFDENSFYYTGKVANVNSIVKTTPIKLVDYVANNLQFYKIDNDNWDVIDTNTLAVDDPSSYVNHKLADSVKQYNTVIQTNATSKIANVELVPELYKEFDNSSVASVTDTLVLSQLITSENKTDDLTYRNIVEIVESHNTIGRRNVYSIAGNQDPMKDSQEVDTDVAQIVRILPPFGNGGVPYIAAAIILGSSLILIAGIVFIRKKILK